MKDIYKFQAISEIIYDLALTCSPRLFVDTFNIKLNRDEVKDNVLLHLDVITHHFIKLYYDLYIIDGTGEHLFNYLQKNYLYIKLSSKLNPKASEEQLLEVIKLSKEFKKKRCVKRLNKLNKRLDEYNISKEELDKINKLVGTYKGRLRTKFRKYGWEIPKI